MLHLEGDALAGGVVVLPYGLDIRLVDDEVADRRHPGSLRVVDRVPDRDAPGLDHLAVDAERQMPLPLLVRGLGPARVERAQRAEVGEAAVGVLGRDRAAADVAADVDERRADADVVPHPLALLVRSAAVELEEHAEAPAVDGAVPVALPAELLERGAGDEGDVAPGAIDRGAGC